MHASHAPRTRLLVHDHPRQIVHADAVVAVDTACPVLVDHVVSGSISSKTADDRLNNLAPPAQVNEANANTQTGIHNNHLAQSK